GEECAPEHSPPATEWGERVDRPPVHDPEEGQEGEDEHRARLRRLLARRCDLLGSSPAEQALGSNERYSPHADPVLVVAHDPRWSRLRPSRGQLHLYERWRIPGEPARRRQFAGALDPTGSRATQEARTTPLTTRSIRA